MPGGEIKWLIVANYLLCQWFRTKDSFNNMFGEIRRNTMRMKKANVKKKK